MKYCKLIMITTENNNKFYTMSWDGTSSTFNVEYGRVESSSVKITKPIGKWESIRQSKIKKGYKDVTQFVTEDIKTFDFKKEDNQDVNRFIHLMQQYRDNLVKTTYSVKASSVTLIQLEEAQKLLDKLQKLKNENVINKTLIDLYTIIPRFMTKVNNYLLPNIDIDEVLVKEQDNLDALSSVVKVKPVSNKDSYLSKINVKIEPVVKDIPELEYILEQSSYHSSTPLKNRDIDIYQVFSNKEQKQFKALLRKKKKQNIKYLIHGTRCSSVLSIIEQGLKIRPSGNNHFSGKVYGEGNYFSETVKKSLNYTGHDSDKILLIYEVYVGNPFIYEGWFKGNSFELSEKELLKRGYDSTYVKAGGGLLNTEVIVYNEQQQNLKYIIHLKT